MSDFEKLQPEAVNLSELFLERGENPAYDFKWGPVEELDLGNKTIIWRKSANPKGVEWGVVVGVKESDVFEKDDNEFINVSSLSPEDKRRVEEQLQGQVRGKIDFIN